MPPRRLPRWLPVLALLASAPGLADGSRTVSVAAAANLKPAMDEIAARFQASHPGVEVKVTFGASGTFLAQIANGAPFDLFLSADAEFPAKAVEQGLADGRAFPYAVGRLVVWVPRDSTLDLNGKGLQALADPAVRKIAMANPEVAPYGRAARAALEACGLYDRLKGRVVLGQNVSQAAQFALSASTQGGIVALSLALAPGVLGGARYVAVDASMHEPLEQRMVLTRRAGATARAFYEYLQQPAARAVLRRYGFALPGV